MKLSEALEEVKKVKPNGFDDDTLTLFINKLEQNAFETLRTPLEQRKRYKWSEDADVTLVIPPPYDNAYISWLKAQIDFNNEEHASYANNQAQFNIDYEEFEKWVIRTGAATPIPPKKFNLGGPICDNPPPKPPSCDGPRFMFDSKELIEATQMAVAATGNANSAANAANSAANIAYAATAVARDAAEDANEQAGRAETAADTANEKIAEAIDVIADANDAISNAETATTEANKAKANADNAATSANNAASLASTATTNAIKATETATSAAILANTAADSANTAASSATSAAQNATEKASEADSAAQSANTAASGANSATNAANTATGNANTAAQAANTAASSANDAAADANEAATSASSAATAANNAATQLQDKVDAGDFTASVTVGTVTTGEPGTQASVSNSGTNKDAVLDFTIPRGDTGDVENLSEQPVTFTEAQNNDKIASGETLSTLFGKTSRLFTRTGEAESDITEIQSDIAISEETIAAFKALGWTPPEGGGSD